MIKIESAGDNVWVVTVRGDFTTQHRVNVSPADIRRLGGENFGAVQLLHASFRFLLDREPNTSILTAFDLGVIARYFPEYEREIARYLKL